MAELEPRPAERGAFAAEGKGAGIVAGCCERRRSGRRTAGCMVATAISSGCKSGSETCSECKGGKDSAISCAFLCIDVPRVIMKYSENSTKPIIGTRGSMID